MSLKEFSWDKNADYNKNCLEKIEKTSKGHYAYIQAVEHAPLTIEEILTENQISHRKVHTSTGIKINSARIDTIADFNYNVEEIRNYILKTDKNTNFELTLESMMQERIQKIRLRLTGISETDLRIQGIDPNIFYRYYPLDWAYESSAEIIQDYDYDPFANKNGSQVPLKASRYDTLFKLEDDCLEVQFLSPKIRAGNSFTIVRASGRSFAQISRLKNKLSKFLDTSQKVLDETQQDIFNKFVKRNKSSPAPLKQEIGKEFSRFDEEIIRASWFAEKNITEGYVKEAKDLANKILKREKRFYLPHKILAKAEVIDLENRKLIGEKIPNKTILESCLEHYSDAARVCKSEEEKLSLNLSKALIAFQGHKKDIYMETLQEIVEKTPERLQSTKDYKTALFRRGTHHVNIGNKIKGKKDFTRLLKIAPNVTHYRIVADSMFGSEFLKDIYGFEPDSADLF